MGGDAVTCLLTNKGFKFQLTPPMWVATKYQLGKFKLESISTHTTHVGGDRVDGLSYLNYNISTHTTHVGGDVHRNKKSQ